MRVRVASTVVKGVVGAVPASAVALSLSTNISICTSLRTSDFASTSLFRARKARTARGPGAAYKFHVTTFLKRKCLTPEFSPRAGDRDAHRHDPGPG